MFLNSWYSVSHCLKMCSKLAHLKYMWKMVVLVYDFGEGCIKVCDKSDDVGEWWYDGGDGVMVIPIQAEWRIST